MKNINTCTFAGNLVADAVQPADGFTTFSLAVNGEVRNDDGGWDEEVNFLDFSISGKRGGALIERGYLKKGQHVLVQAHARMRKWTAKDGTTHSAVRFIVDEIDIVNSQKQ